jgi:transcription termination/antitermination protein NusG
MARWYIIHAHSGFESKVKENILADAEKQGLSALVENVEVPSEMVTEVKRGKKTQVERKTMPGYVLAKLNLNDDIYHLIRNNPKVSGFLGVMGRPQAISEAEAARYFGAAKEAQAKPKNRVEVAYDIGDTVKVLEGPFASFNGVVEDLDFDKNKVKVSVSIFGRATPVELNFEQVELSK